MLDNSFQNIVSVKVDHPVMIETCHNQGKVLLSHIYTLLLGFYQKTFIVFNIYNFWKYEELYISIKNQTRIMLTNRYYSFNKIISPEFKFWVKIEIPLAIRWQSR